MAELAETGRGFSANSSGGVRDFGNEYMIRGIARTNDLEELGETLVKTVNNWLWFRRADLVIGSAVKYGFASENGERQ